MMTNRIFISSTTESSLWQPLENGLHPTWCIPQNEGSKEHLCFVRTLWDALFYILWVRMGARGLHKVAPVAELSPVQLHVVSWMWLQTPRTHKETAECSQVHDYVPGSLLCYDHCSAVRDTFLDPMGEWSMYGPVVQPTTLETTAQRLTLECANCKPLGDRKAYLWKIYGIFLWASGNRAAANRINKKIKLINAVLHPICLKQLEQL